MNIGKSKLVRLLKEQEENEKKSCQRMNKNERKTPERQKDAMKNEMKANSKVIGK